MTKSKRRIGNISFCKNFLIDFSRLLRFGKIVVKISANELITFNSGDINLCLVHVGNFAFRADGNQRIQAGFDQAAGI